MTPQDSINGTFEFIGSFMLLRNVLALYKAKKVSGVSILTFAFYAVWGFWNLAYYPSLGQWWSFAAGIGVVVVNTLWVVLAMYYTYRRPPSIHSPFGSYPLWRHGIDDAERARLQRKP